MRFPDSLKIVTRNLRRRKGRTILTAIGVTIGTAAIVAMMSLAIGLKENVVRSVSRFGALTEIQVYPGWNRDNPKSVPQINDSAVARIKLIPGVKAVMPRLRFNGPAQIEVGRRTGNIEVIGVDTLNAANFEYQMESGHYLSGGHNEGVVSYNVTELLTENRKRSRKSNETFDNVQPGRINKPGTKTGLSLKPELIKRIGTISINKSTNDGTVETKQIKVKIVGMLTKTQNPWGGGVIHLPLRLVEEMNQWAGAEGSGGRSLPRGGSGYESLVVKVPDTGKVKQITDYIRAMGYNASSPAAELEEVNKVFLVIQIVLGGIGAISLLVATIGIINTMVMSILERTREIGIMKVLGATIPNVRNLFLMEAGSIGFIGGIAGLAISYSIAGIINMIFRRTNFLQMPEEAMGNIAVIPLWLSLFALGFATVVGVLAGLYPALRAAKLSPLNAIRQE